MCNESIIFGQPNTDPDENERGKVTGNPGPTKKSGQLKPKVKRQKRKKTM
jgi:hypothetical protein